MGGVKGMEGRGEDGVDGMSPSCRQKTSSHPHKLFPQRLQPMRSRASSNSGTLKGCTALCAVWQAQHLHGHKPQDVLLYPTS